MNFDEMQAVANAATPGPWDVGIFGDGNTNYVETENEADVEYIRLFTPQTVLLLLGLVRAMRAGTHVEGDHDPEGCWTCEVLEL